ncbi:MAG: flagellar biosynthesis regulator FlaF [Thiobacillus sp.]
MNPEQFDIDRAQSGIRPARGLPFEAIRLDDIAAQLMTVQRYWNAPGRESQLAGALAESRRVWGDIQAALAAGSLSLPADVQHNLLILSVYAESKIGSCASTPSAEALSGLIALTRTLAGSLREWRAAA